MSNPRNTLASNLSAFRQEWSKARRHMLAGKQRNITHWRERAGGDTVGPPGEAARAGNAELER